ncbi:MAG: arginine repressor [Clostridia bacterium]|nr:arginine repressor [Clostridia bacterium]
MKSKRHALIFEIIAAKDIETQEELADELRLCGVDVTQATVSRDIKELRLVKVLSANGTYKYAPADRSDTTSSDRYLRIFSEAVLSIRSAGNLIVLKTMTASAQTAAEVIDNLDWPEIIGTIAGDNTVLVIVQNIEDVDETIQKFRNLTGKRA